MPPKSTPSPITLHVQSFQATHAYSQLIPAPTAILRCYLTNQKACGNIFFLCHSTGDTYWGRSGHVKTGIGSVTEKNFETKEDVDAYVDKMIRERVERDGDGRFAVAEIPLALSVKEKKKGVKMKNNGVKLKKGEDEGEEEEHNEEKGEEEKEEEEEDLPIQKAYTVNLTHTSAPTPGGDGVIPKKWYQIRYNGDHTGSLSFGKVGNGDVKSKGSMKSKTFGSIRAASSYFENHVVAKRKDGYVVDDDDDGRGSDEEGNEEGEEE